MSHHPSQGILGSVRHVAIEASQSATTIGSSPTTRPNRPKIPQYANSIHSVAMTHFTPPLIVPAVIVGAIVLAASDPILGQTSEDSAVPTAPTAPTAPASTTTTTEATVSVIPRGSSNWLYLDTGDGPGDGWAELEFDDSGWGSGAAPLGYGEDDVATEISFGENPEEKHAAAYFRLPFDVSDQKPDAETVTYGGRIRFDDGVIVFLNGREIYRMNMGPDGEPGPDAFSKGKVSSRSRWEGRYEKFFIAADTVLEGENILAAQVHQSDAGSSDLILDFELVQLSDDDARREAIPDLYTTPSGDTAEPVAGAELYLDDMEVVRNIAVKGKRLLADGKTVPGRSLMRDMENNRQFSIFGLPIPIGGTELLTPAQLYKKSTPSVLIISPVSESSDPNNPGEGWGSGFVIAASGIAVTNWHVIEAMKDADSITATTFDGRVFPLTKVLAARKNEDIAVVQLDTLGQTLAPLAFASGTGVGEQVTIISHPRTNFFNLTNGYISRYFKSRANGARLVSVTADIAGGSSGAPMLNRRGEVIGVVSMTESLSANPLHSQRTSGADDEVDEDDETPDSEAEEGEAPESDDKESAPRERQQRTQIIPSSHQMTMKYGSPAVSVLELLE